MKSFVINANDANQRLDKFILKATTSMVTSLMYKYLRQKRIKVNGKKCEQSYRLVENDLVEMYIPDEFFVSPEQSFKYLIPKIDIAYEDSNIILVNKAVGVSCQPDENQKSDTLIDHLKAYLFQEGKFNPDIESSFAPALCNRIDRNTAGLVICAKNAEALRVINEMIKNRQVRKKYLALVHGKPIKEHAVLQHYLKKDASQNMVEVFERPKAGALTAITEYTLKRYDSKKDISLIEAELHTGRTHQIRAQMAFIGHPLAGDGKYGVNRDDKKMGYKFQALFSYSLEFIFNDSSNPLYYLKDKVFVAKIDERFADWLK